MAWCSAVAGKEIVLEACEADDASYALRRFGEPHWHSDWQELGQWRFASAAHIACGGDSCAVSTVFHLTFEDGSKPVVHEGERYLPSPLPHHERDGIEQTILKNERAANLRTAIGNEAYQVSDNEIGMAWVSYGRLAQFVRLRSRTEIRCRTNERRCSIENNIIAFVSYDEHNECGYLSEDADPDDLLY